MIDAHKDFQQCRLESSLHSILNAVGNDKLTVHGSQVWQVRQGEVLGRSQNDNTQWPLPGAATQPRRGMGNCRGSGYHGNNIRGQIKRQRTA